MVFYVFSRIYCVVWIVLNISSIEVVQDCTRWEQWVLTCSLDLQNPPNKLETSQDMFRVWQKVRDSQPQGTTSLSRNHLNSRNTAPCNKSHEGHKWQHLFSLQLYLLYLLQTKLDVSMFLGKAGGHACFFCFFFGRDVTMQSRERLQSSLWRKWLFTDHMETPLQSNKKLRNVI